MSSNPESKFGYKFANAVEEKSFWVGGAGLAFALFVPELAGLGVGIATIEALQIMGAEGYKGYARSGHIYP